MATNVNVGAWSESMRRMSQGIGQPCYSARAVLAMSDAMLRDAARLTALATAREGGVNATRMLDADIVQTQSRFASYTAALASVPNGGTTVDHGIVCESVLGYLLDGRTSDGTALALPSSEVQLVASLWNRAHTLARTLAPADTELDAATIVAQAGADALDAIGGAGASAAQAVERWRVEAGALVREVASTASGIAGLLAVGVGAGLVLWLLVRK